MRQALVVVSRYATTADAARWVANAFYTVAHETDGSPPNRVCALSVQDALVAIARCATTPDGVRWVAQALHSVTRCKSSSSVRDALVAMPESATTPDSVRWVAGAVAKVARGDNAYCTSIVRDALVALSRHA
ncbi:GPI-anchored surface protein, putative, partial [Bodo saltans]